MARITEKTRPGQSRIRALRQSVAQQPPRNKGYVGDSPLIPYGGSVRVKVGNSVKKQSPMTNKQGTLNGWFQYDCVLDLAYGTQNNYRVVE